MADTPEFDQEQEFNKMMDAVVGGDHEALSKIMDAENEPNQNTVVKDHATPAEGEVKDPALEAGETQVVVPAEEEAKTAAVEVPPTEGTKPEIPEDTKAELDRLRQEVHRYKSDAGRVPYTQKRMQELEREVATLRAGKAAQTGTPSGSEAELDPETAAVIEELKITDPVMAKALETVARKSAAATAAKVTSAFDEYSKTTQEADDERYFAEQYSLLTNQIPHAPQIFASNEWKQWKQSLSPNRRAMAESVHADEVATAIYAFASDMQRMGVQAPQQPAAAAAVTQEQTEAVQKAIQERTRKVQTAAEVTTAAAKATEEFDEDKAYLEIYNRLAKANHIT